MKEGFAFGFDPEEIKKTEEELKSLDKEILELEAEYKAIEHGPANDARIKFENKILSLKTRREKIIEELFSVGLSNDAILRRVFKSNPEDEDFLQ